MTDSDFSKGEAEADWKARFEESIEVKRIFANLTLVEKPVRVNAGFSLLIPSYGHNWAAVGEASACFDPLSNFGLGRSAEMGEKLALEFVAAENEGRAPDLLGISERLGMEWKIHFRRLLSSYRQIRRFPDSVFWARRSAPVAEDNLLRVRKNSPEPGKLIIPEDLNFECTQCGLCCGPLRHSAVSLKGSRELIKSEIGQAVKARTGYLPVKVLDDGSLSTADREDGGCQFLTTERQCELHDTPYKPRSCRQFPFIMRETPEGIVVGLSYGCPSVQANSGRPLEEYRAELEAIIKEKQPNVMPRLVSITWGQGVSWEVYSRLENFLTEGQEVCTRTSPALWGLSRWLLNLESDGPSYDVGKSGFHEELQGAAACVFIAQIEHDDLDRQVEFQALLFDGSPFELEGCGFSGRLPDLAPMAETMDNKLFASIVDRFLRNLIRRKFLLSHGPVFHNLIILHTIRQLLAVYTAAFAAGSGSERIEEKHMHAALGLVEDRLTGPNRYQIEAGSLFKTFVSL